ncbi:MOSC domain-containing protein YiiM [Pseudoxanthomonas sp. 3HH-4]|uniref:MOSC domain-containing protein n=1 Tax=Pseudoxanthomonas sp. 3HH-4 TaxID=1690214 RepID=UPI001153816A|nr:MOSC domain-containing protein [Pseudoxanthomonas sp. 3HH-4]TQM10642.1 MOSC domain-containing protein YiiM [Pseudoxanthomonas sp. 3HH-4]
MSATMEVMALTIDGVLAGKAVEFTRPGSRSAIAKSRLEGRQPVTLLGILGDEQGDLRVHGGPDKAIHHYPADHYARWRDDIGAHPLLDAPGAFGENISTHGMTEDAICLGDRFRLGTALVEVSQSRQPCWKLSDRFAVSDMARRVQESGRTGWYYRVLEEGEVQAGDRMTLEARPHPTWPLARLIELLYRRSPEPALLRDVLLLPLVPSWRTLFERRLAQGAIEDWGKRLTGASSHA